MATQLHWVEGPWPGKLALSARPRGSGSDWLDHQIAGWRRARVDVMVPLSTAEEEREFDLWEERGAATGQGMEFISFLIPDRHVPDSEERTAEVVERVDAGLESGGNTVIHCRQGVRRSGLMAPCLLVTHGIDSNTAVVRLGVARGVTIPETLEQRRSIYAYAATSASIK